MNDIIVSRVEQARALLEQATDAKSAQKVHNMAHAAEIYARRQKLSDESIAFAHQVKIDALRRMGEYLRQAPKNKGAKGNPGGRGNKNVRCQNGTTQPETYAEAGIDKKTAATSQFLDTVAEQSPELFEQVREGTLSLPKAKAAAKKKKKEQARQQMAETGKTAPLSDFAQVITGDFREIMAAMPDESVDMIFTDPPYDEASIHLYGDLARLAALKLKKNGSLLAYAGHYALPEIFELMTPHLRFWWTLAIQQLIP